jgi:hypothetical protein
MRHSTGWRGFRWAALVLACWSCLTSAPAAPAKSPPRSLDSFTVDFRYAPAQWQTAICLPDDWQKTLVGRDGSLLYDYPGRFAGFGLRIAVDLEGGSAWIGQELQAPRLPVVRTRREAGTIEMTQSAFALAPPLPLAHTNGLIKLERVDSPTGQNDWASPPPATDPAFRNAAIGWNRAVHYRFPAGSGKSYAVVMGLCEGWHHQPGQRILLLEIEGRTRRTVDLVSEKGRNVPMLFPFSARDEDGDGWIEVAVAAAESSPDKNTFLNLLWVFEGSALPATEKLIGGSSDQPALAHLDCGADSALDRPPRHDLVLVRLANHGPVEAQVTPTITVEGRTVAGTDDLGHRIELGAGTTLLCGPRIERAEPGKDRLVLRLAKLSIPAAGEKAFAVAVARGGKTADPPLDVAQVEAFQRKAKRFWIDYDLPYDRIQIPDPGVQALLDGSIRNIYQAREIKKGLPAFQVGPTCYRGLWVVDGSFLLEAVTYLGRIDEARRGIDYLLSFQREDGAIMLINGHWKETGIALWAVTRHARLTGDPDWLRTVWPHVERGFEYIRKLRKMASEDPTAPNAGLIPAGFSDGGLAGRVPEYTNIYWTLAGMRAAVEAARWLGLDREAEDWQAEYDDFMRTFRRAAKRDMREDGRGNRYLPIRMVYDPAIPPQKAQWAFLHALFPGKVFSPDDPLVQGNMAMLKAVEDEGLVLDTGWLKDGIWTYFGSFYGHAWLCLGEGEKAARTLYAFGNHASPLLAWREEQKPVGQGNQMVGDMPHNWASAEFIRLVRHTLLLERGHDLHLFEAMPPSWARPGAVLRLRDIVTEFGPVTLDFRVSKDGSTAHLKLEPPQRTPPQRIVLHLNGWSGRSGTIELPTRGAVDQKMDLIRR